MKKKEWKRIAKEAQGELALMKSNLNAGEIFDGNLALEHQVNVNLRKMLQEKDAEIQVQEQKINSMQQNMENIYKELKEATSSTIRIPATFSKPEHVVKCNDEICVVWCQLMRERSALNDDIRRLESELLGKAQMAKELDGTRDCLNNLLRTLTYEVGSGFEPHSDTYMEVVNEHTQGIFSKSIRDQSAAQSANCQP